MSLKVLNIIFQSMDAAFAEINEAVKANKKLIQKKNVMYFDSPKTWRSFMSTQKHEILTSVSRCNPESVYGLAKLIGRPSQHVLKDCRELESVGFLNLIETDSLRKSLRPELKFAYDFIRVSFPVQTFLPISEESMKVLDAAVG